jgi:hypothetical protein
MGNVKTQGSGIRSYEYDRNYMKEHEEWLAILRATEHNPTLKELADQLRIMYHVSKQEENEISTWGENNF